MVLPNSLFKRDQEYGAHFLRGGGIQVAGGLVGENQRRVGDDGARHGHALLLPAGKLARQVMQAVLQAHQLERRGGVLDALGLFQVGQLERQFHVLQRREHRNQVELLEDEADVLVAPMRDLRGRSYRASAWPSTRISPELGRSMAAIRCSSVDLPEPDGPISTTNSPFSMVR
jgi:hypothetical protein